MNRIAITLSIAAAFAAGCGVTHLLRPALAAENITAQVIHTGELEGDALRPANAGGMRNKTVRLGRRRDHLDPGRQPAKHCMPTPTRSSTSSKAPARSGSATRKCTVKPGDLVIIPKGTPHGGTKPDGRTIKAIAIKTPPQAPDDTKLLN